MTRLLRVELKRLVARRIVWLTVIAAVLISLMTVGGVFMAARNIDQARAGVNQEYDRMVEQLEDDRQVCELQQEQERRRTGDASIDYGCDTMRVPTPEEMYGSMPSLAEQYRQLLSGTSYAFMFLALAMGSTAVAAEFSHRTMGSLLTFVPRRSPVWLSKVLAPALAAAPVTLTGLALILVGVPLVFRWFRIDDAVTGAQWTSLGWMALRIVALTMVVGALGAAAAFLVRHSGLVIGILVGYLLLVEAMFLGIGGGNLSRFALTRNIAAWVDNGTTWSTFPLNCGAFEECRETVHRLSFAQGATEILVVLALIAVLGWWRFVRSDVD